MALQQATWGGDFRELVSPAMLLVAQKMGGVAAGAFDGGTLAGFVFGITGVRDGEVAHWSHMLAVAAPRRDAGIGRRLKRYQRAQLLAAGVRRMYWTYDPLVARNAHLNLRHLGATVTAYVRDMYGEIPMSTADTEIGTDRFVVRWDLADGGETAAAPESDAPAGCPCIVTAADPLPDVPVVLVGVPDDIQALKQRDAAAARAWRAASRRAFEHYLPLGYAVAGFHRGGGGRPPAYRLVRGP